MKKTIILVLIALVIGFAAGYVIATAFYGYKMASVMFMLQEKEVFEMEEAALQAYHNQPNEVAIWALENYINTLNRVKEERSSAGVENPYFLLTPIQSLAFCHARIGQLYEKTGNVEKSNYHFEQAMSHVKNSQMKGIKTEADLIDAINRTDQKLYKVNKLK